MLHIPYDMKMKRCVLSAIYSGKNALTATLMADSINLFVAHFVTRTTPMYYIDSKDNNLKLKNSRNYRTNHTRSFL